MFKKKPPVIYRFFVKYFDTLILNFLSFWQDAYLEQENGLALNDYILKKSWLKKS